MLVQRFDHAGLAARFEIAAHRIHADRDPGRAVVIDRVREQHLEHAGGDGLKLLERRNRLGPADNEFDIAFGRRFDALCERLGQHADRRIGLVPARQQADIGGLRAGRQ